MSSAGPLAELPAGAPAGGGPGAPAGAEPGGRPSRRRRRALLDYVPLAVLLALLVAGWQAYVGLFDVSPVVLPPPSDVAAALVERWSTLSEHLAATTLEALQGFLLAAACGIALAVVITSSRMLRLALYPLLVATQAMPVIAIAPLLITWFGFGPTSKVLVSALIAFFPVVVSSAAGLASLDAGAVALMRSFPATRRQIFVSARLPNALPQVFAGLRVAAVLSVVGAVVGEWVGADQGLGYLIVRANASLAIDLVFACIVLLSVLGVVFFVAVALVERLVTPWQRHARAS
jgi:ABC-type nitrate/sulfonate/bicarbonate transport system permease component